jgi:hypothetical protein
MNLKNALSACLLIFVAASIVVLMAKSLQQKPQTAGEESENVPPSIKDGVVVYYFHGKTRCPTCRNIEAYAREAVDTGYADQLKNKDIVWATINYELPGNEHYATDYEIVAPNVVLVKLKDGKQIAWKGLPEVWELVGDKSAFVSFVQTSLKDFFDNKGVQE